MMAWPSLVGISIKGLIEWVAHMCRHSKRGVDLKMGIVAPCGDRVPVLQHSFRPRSMCKGHKGVGGRQSCDPV
jgi:hypothetical protein